MKVILLCIKKEYNQLKDEKEALTLRIETLEEEKNKADEDYDYIVLENMTLQSEIIGLERKIEELKKEHDEKINSLYGELEYIIKKEEIKEVIMKKIMST